MTVTATLRINQDAKVQVYIDDIIEAINNLKIQHRWNYIADMLNGIDLGDKLELNDSQRKIIADYLRGELARFE